MYAAQATPQYQLMTDVSLSAPRNVSMAFVSSQMNAGVRQAGLAPTATSVSITVLSIVARRGFKVQVIKEVTSGHDFNTH